MRDQPAARTAAQVFAQKIARNDRKTKEAVVRALKESSELRRKWAWERAKKLGIATDGYTPGGGRFTLQDFDDRDRPVYHRSQNIGAAVSTATDKIRATAPYNVSGEGMVIGLWEAGSIPRVTHREFRETPDTPGSRILVMGGQSAPITFHATHVAGTLLALGTEPDIMGMLPAAQMHAFDSNDDVAEMTSAAWGMDYDPLLVSNHSYGYTHGWTIDSAGNSIWMGNYTPDANNGDDIDPNFGRYDDYSVALDGLLYNAPEFLPFYAAGNDRDQGPPAANAPWYWLGTGGTPGQYVAGRDPQGDGVYKSGYDTLNGMSVVKNAMVVGAVSKAVIIVSVNPTVRQRDLGVMQSTSFSSQGPTDDGRIKPDIVAVGQSVYSTSDADDEATESSDGTSMASPNAAGSALLLQQLALEKLGQPLMSCALKGLIIHTADDIAPAGPDYATGWGLMNTKAAADVILRQEDETGNGVILIDYLATQDAHNTHSFYCDGTKPVRVTLCWIDPAGAASTTHDDRTAKLVNDLDLSVTGASGGDKLPWVMPYVTSNFNAAQFNAPATTGLNSTDNVEQVLVETSAVVPGLYTVTVNHLDPLTDGGQEYALIITGNALPPDIAVESTLAPAVDLVDELSSLNFGSVEEGETRTITVTIKNTGQAPLEDLTVSIDGADASRFSRTTPALHTLAKDESTTFTVNFTPPVNDIRRFEAALHITSNDPDEAPFDLILEGRSPDPNITLLWTAASSEPISNYDRGTIGYHVDIDAGGNVLVSGSTGELYGGGDNDLFTAKYSPTGNKLWENHNDDDVSDGPSGMVVDTQGNVTVLAAGSHHVPGFPTPVYRDYILKYRADGSLQWAQRHALPPGFNQSSPVVLSLDGAGQAYALLQFVDKDSYGNPSNVQYAVRKHDSASGAVLWQHDFDPLDYYNGLVLDGRGGLFTPGVFRIIKINVANGTSVWQVEQGNGGFYWGGTDADANGDLLAMVSVPNEPDPYALKIRKYSGASGATLWTSPDASASGYTNLLQVDAAGDVIWASVIPPNLDLRVAKYAGASGVKLWESTTVYHTPQCLELDANGDVYVMGQAEDAGDSNDDAFLMKIDGSSGALKWKHVEDDWYFYDMAVGSKGRIAATGFDNPATGLWAKKHTMLYLETLPPEVTTTTATVTVDEGGEAAAAGTFFDINGNETVTLTATRNGTAYGVVTPNAEAGTWSWAYPTTDGPNDGGTVVITANDGMRDPATTSFLLTVNNVAPAFEAGGDISIPSPTTAINRNFTFTDPGTDVWTAQVSYGDGSPVETLGVNQGAKSFSLSHSYAAAGSYTVTITVSDGDPGGEAVDTFSVLVGGTLRTLESWRMTHFSTSANTGDAADMADKDRDDLPNLLEFAFDLDPNQSDPSAVPQPTKNGANFTFTFNEPPGTTGITYGAEYAASLTGTWLPMTDTGTGGTHVFSAPLGANTRLFVRLKVIVNP